MQLSTHVIRPTPVTHTHAEPTVLCGAQRYELTQQLGVLAVVVFPLHHCPMPHLLLVFCEEIIRRAVVCTASITK